MNLKINDCVNDISKFQEKIWIRLGKNSFGQFIIVLMFVCWNEYNIHVGKRLQKISFVI